MARRIQRLVYPCVVACPGLPLLRARDMSAPDPETARYAVSTATVTGAICRVPIWVVMAPSRIREKGAERPPPGGRRTSP